MNEMENQFEENFTLFYTLELHHRHQSTGLLYHADETGRSEQMIQRTIEWIAIGISERNWATTMRYNV